MRDIAEHVGFEKNAELASYHLNELQRNGLIMVNLQEGVLYAVKRGYCKEGKIYNIPVVNRYLTT